MARGRRTSLIIRLTPTERQTLLVWQRATAIPAGLARRGRIILLLADGLTITDIAATVVAAVGLPRPTSWDGRDLHAGEPRTTSLVQNSDYSGAPKASGALKALRASSSFVSTSARSSDSSRSDKHG